MSDYKPLNSDEIREISNDYFNARGKVAAHVDNPVIVLIGAQPGAGKSRIADMAKDELKEKGGYIHVDADRMREKIPYSGEKPTSQETQADAGKLAGTLRGVATENRRNIIEEGTFRNSEDVEKFIAGRKSAGYGVELMAVATPREESILGIYQRYEMQHQAGSDNPRFVPIDYHDKALEGFDKTLSVHADKLDRVRVMDRAGNTLFDSNSKENAQNNPLEAVNAGRKVTDSKLIAYSDAWERVEKSAIERGASADYISGIHEQKNNIEDKKRERIHAHAMENLKENISALQKDSRYSGHSQDEIIKASYFRGFHEKSAEFNGKSADFVKYDNAMVSKPNLADLPNVADLEGVKVDKTQSQGRERSNDDHSL